MKQARQVSELFKEMKRSVSSRLGPQIVQVIINDALAGARSAALVNDNGDVQIPSDEVRQYVLNSSHFRMAVGIIFDECWPVVHDAIVHEKRARWSDQRRNVAKK